MFTQGALGMEEVALYIVLERHLEHNNGQGTDKERLKPDFCFSEAATHVGHT